MTLSLNKQNDPPARNGWMDTLFGRSHRPEEPPRLDRDAIELLIRIGLVAVLIYWTSIIVFPFVPILAWSVIMAVALYPAFDWLAAALGGRPKIAAGVITLVSLLLVIGPVTWLAIDLVEASRDLIENGGGASMLTIPPPPLSVKDWALVGPSVYEYWDAASKNVKTVLAPLVPQLKPLGEKLIETLSSAGLGTLKFLVSVLVMGFLFLSAPALVELLETLAAKVDRANGVRSVELAGATIRAVSRGAIGVSLLQAIVAGVGMALASVPGASILTLLVLVLGIVQVGPGLVSVPVVIWAWMTMAPAPAIGLTLCMAIVGLSDAFLKPVVLSHGLTTPTMVTFVGVVGGIIAHGIIGLFVGPIVVAVAWNLAGAWMKRNRAEA
jgi:predicted PurR-regulated permease PerM